MDALLRVGEWILPACLTFGSVLMIMGAAGGLAWHGIWYGSAPEDIVTLRRFGLLMLVCSLSFAATAAPSAGLTPEEAFNQLKHLVGRWNGKFPDGRPHSVTYTLTAGGTVLLETWALAPGRESLTLYHMDGDDLVATHYCPQGNQPRLRFARGNDPAKLSFAFRDGTNLRVNGRSHQASFWIRIIGDKSFVRSETYVENGAVSSTPATADPDEPITYMRTQ